MRLGGMPFAVAAAVRVEESAGDVEVAQAHGGQPVRARVIADRQVDGQLACAIRVGGRGRRGLADRLRVWLAVRRRGGGEDQARDAVGTHRVQQGECASDVVVPVAVGLRTDSATSDLAAKCMTAS